MFFARKHLSLLHDADGEADGEADPAAAAAVAAARGIEVVGTLWSPYDNAQSSCDGRCGCRAVVRDAGAEEPSAGDDSADFGDEMEFSDSALDVQPGGGAVIGGAAPTASGSATTAPAGAFVARSDSKFKADARVRGLHADSNIPHAQVLARPPDAASAGRERCPPPLWALIQTHGGYGMVSHDPGSSTNSGCGGKTRSAAARVHGALLPR